MELKRNWVGVNPHAVAKCSEAHIAYLVEDAIADIARLSLANREMLEAIQAASVAPMIDHSQKDRGVYDILRAAIAKATGNG